MGVGGLIAGLSSVADMGLNKETVLVWAATLPDVVAGVGPTRNLEMLEAQRNLASHSRAWQTKPLERRHTCLPSAHRYQGTASVAAFGG